MEKTLQKQEIESDPAVAPIAPTAHADETGLPQDDFDRDVWCVLGLPIDAADVNQAMGAIDAAVRRRTRLSFVTPNVNWLVRALREPAARREILNADLSLVDGAPLAAAARRIGAPIAGRVAGSDLFEALRRRPGFAGRRIKVFFFGGRDGAADAAMEALNRDGGGLKAVGALNPGFGDVEEMSAPAVIDEINAADPDFVVAALGAAKGQAWIDRNQAQLNAPVIAHLGAVVDFTGGGVTRAPDLFRRLGLEWGWRILAEPALWRRYLKDGLAMLSILATRSAALQRPAREADAEPDVTLEQGPGAIRIKLKGAIGAPGLGPVRRAFRAAADSPDDVIVDLEGAASIDHAFLGLLLMLEKHVVNPRRTLSVDGASAGQLAFLRANAMNYPASSASGARSSKVAAA